MVLQRRELTKLSNGAIAWSPYSTFLRELTTAGDREYWFSIGNHKIVEKQGEKWGFSYSNPATTKNIRRHLSSHLVREL